MIKNEDEPSQPCAENNHEYYHYGLTKLEQATITLAAGIMANPNSNNMSIGDIKKSATQVARSILGRD